MIRNKYYRNLVVLMFALALITGLSIDVAAQKKSRRAKAKAKARLIIERRKGAEDVGTQVKNVTKFVFVLGGIATGIEDIDKEIKAGRATKKLRDTNAKYKENVMRSIRALRASLVKLEIDFRTKPALKPYLVYIQGIIDESAQAEDFASAGNFRRSGQQFLLVIEKLTDVLVKMP